jgi:uncharacterized protein (TIGR03437 family)
MSFRLACAAAFFLSLSSAQTSTIREIEVNQAIGRQLNGAADYVAGKDTAIRVFLAATATIDPENTRLVIERNGTRVTELAPRPYPEPVAIVEFLCPTRAACGNWQEGNYRFTATVNGETISTTTAIVFRERQALRILVRPVKANYNGTIQSVTGDRWRRSVEYVRHVYPVAADKITWTIQDEFDASDARFNLETNDGERNLWQALTDLLPPHCATNRKADGCFDLIVGFIQSRNLGFPNGTGQGFTMGAPTNIVVASDEDMESTVAHEIAHIYGAGDTYADGSIRCAVNPAPNGFNGKDWDNREQTTSCTAGRLPATGISATLIPADARAYEVGGRGDLGAKACFMGSGGKAADYWITPDVYKRLFDSLDPVNPIQQALASQRRTTAQRVVNFAGFLNNAFDVDKEPWFTLTTTEPAPDTTGPIVLRAVDASGAVLASQALSPQFIALTNPPRTIEKAPFEGVIRFPANTNRFEIFANGVIKQTIPVNPTDPILAGVTPTAPGSTLAGPATIQWSATATGPEPLSYLVEYNPNPAANPLDWTVLASELTAPLLDDDFSTLPGGAQAKIRVTATDGIRSVSAESATFRVPFKAPEVYIDDTPANITTGQDLPLIAEVFDLQDDVVADSRILWRSSLSGILGAGAQIVARALAPGRHVITVTATNSLGLTTVDTITVDVNPAPVTIALTTACPLPSATAGTPYTQTLTATGGNGLYTFAISAGNLPAGLSLRNRSGLWIIDGIPANSANANFTLQVTDSSNPPQSAVRGCSLTVNPAPVTPVVPGAPAALRLVRGDNQSALAGQTLPLAFVAQLVDASGLAIVGQTAIWDVPTLGSINLTNVVTTTDTTGHVSALGVLGNLAGAHQVRVRVGAFTQTFNFTTTAVNNRLNRLSGDAQVGYTNRPFAAPLVVELRDGANQPVRAQAIQWSVVQGAATLGAPSSTTGADGRATVTVLAGNTPGPILVRATAGSLSANFALTSYGPGPLVAPSAVTTTARNLPGLVPCALATLTGLGLAPGVDGAVLTNPNNSGPLPLASNGLSVEIGGVPAPLFAVSNQNGVESVIVQTPCDLPAPSLSFVAIRVGNAEQRLESIPLLAAAPGIFETAAGSTAFAGLTRPDDSYVTPTNPARRGETVRLAVTGLGQTTPALATNQRPGQNQAVRAPLAVRVAGVTARVVSALAAPGQLGVYLITFEIPNTVAPGAFAALSVTTESASGATIASNPSTIAAIQ